MATTYHKNKRQTVQDYYDDKADAYDGSEQVIIVRKRQFISDHYSALRFEAYYKPLAYVFSEGLTQQDAIDGLHSEFVMEGLNPDVLENVLVKRYLD